MNKEILTEKIKEFRVPVLGALFAIVLVAIYFIRTGPAEELNQRYSDLNDEVRQLFLNQRNGGDLSANLETIKQFTSLMHERLISQNLADIHDVFYTLERKAGVTLESIPRPEMVSETMQPKANEVQYQPLSMAVTVSGTFKNVLKFVHSLENSPLLYRYSGLKVSNKTKAIESDIVSLTLNLELLSRNEK